MSEKYQYIENPETKELHRYLEVAPFKTPLILNFDEYDALIAELKAVYKKIENFKFLMHSPEQSSQE